VSTKDTPIIIDLDAGKESVVNQVTEILKRYSTYLKEGDISLSFVLRQSGKKDKEFDYNFTRDGYDNAEKDVVFPIVVKEILRKELPEKIASNQRLVNHVMQDLKRDPYWSTNVIKLLDAIQVNSK
jgi:hypothetical protein